MLLMIKKVGRILFSKVAYNEKGLAKKWNWHYKSKIGILLMPCFSSAEQRTSSHFFAKPLLPAGRFISRNLIKERK